MKIERIPTKIYETGDKVSSPKGKAVVIHDELDGILVYGTDLAIAEIRGAREDVHIRLVEYTSDYRGGAEFACDRRFLELIKNEGER